MKKPKRAPSAAASDPRLGRVDALARLLDDSIPIPGTGRRIGVDAVIGLVPGFGDGAGALLSLYVIVQAARLGVDRATLLRMAGNVAVEALVGVVPLAGDLFDAAFKANLRNVRLLRGHLDAPEPVRRSSRRWAGGVIGGLVLLLLAIAVIAVWLAGQLWQAAQTI